MKRYLSYFTFLKKIASLAFCIALLSLCVVRQSLADGCLQRNPPGSTAGDASSPCGCSISGKEVADVGNDCIKILLGMGETTPWTGSRELALKVFADDASQLLFTPDSLYAIAGYTFKRIGNAVMEDGETPKEVVFSHPNGESVKFVFNEGESLARPDPNVHIPMDERLQMVDAQGWATTKNPVYWDLYLGDGRVRRYVASADMNDRGRFISETDARGCVYTSADMGIDIIYDMSGVRQFLTPSRLADVKTSVDGYEVRIYAIDAPLVKDTKTNLYPIPNSKPYRILSIKSENKGYRAIVMLKIGDNEAKTYIFNYVMGDWELIRPNGVREIKDRMVAEEVAARLSKVVKSQSGQLLSKAVMNYKSESWGYAMTNKVEGFAGTERITSWSYYTSGSAKGKLKTCLEPSGLLTSYIYDEQGRKTSEKRSGPDMMTEVTTYDYTPVDASDPLLSVDTRPRTIVKTLNGIECERTYYVYAPLTNIVERVGTQGAAYGGTNVLRTVTVFYPVMGGPLSSAVADGRVASVRHEDGKLDLYDYALNDGVWMETVTHVHEQSPAPISGKTTRDITLTNARGEVIETRKEAFIDNAWHTIARERKTYNAEGKRIKSENLAGQVTTTAWDCCHKISETQPDGSTTMWDYDDEGRMVASSRLIPMDMTNVTWLTTCYEYDDLGRQIATWQTNRAAKVSLPVTRTCYDQLGRIVARVDQLGNTTTTSYSNDGRTVSVKNPNTSTRVITRSADGDTLSITGSAVTPEFHTYGVLHDGTRWAKTVQGETADSPRFTKRYENILGQTVREERSGFQGAVLATTHAYDSLGRLVSTSADYKPCTEYTYDVLGNRVATTKTVGGDDPGAPQPADTQWRKSESLSHIAIIDGDIWLTQTNIVSCSDSAIAPLVSSFARQLTGLTAALPARSRTTDIRGNVTENEMLVDSSIVTSRQTLPYATNKPLSFSRYGVSLMDVSVSAVTNTVAYDALGSQIANTDGRGNTRHVEYNSFGQRSASIDALGNRTSYAYDQFGNLASVTDPLGNATVYEYDLRGFKTYEGGATYPVRYTYDIFGNKTMMMTYRDELLGPNSGDVTTWLYDIASGSMTNKVYADGKGPTYTYAPDGKLSRRIWARSITTDYSYDNWGSLTNTVYSDNTPTVSLTYDALGRQISVHDAAGLTAFLYDSFGSLTNETVVGIGGTNTIIRHWDNYGRTTGYSLVGRVVPNEPQRQSTLAYDPATGRLASMLAVGSDSPFTWSYLPGSDLKSSLAYPNGLTASWSYDANNQLLQVSNATPTNTISQYDYTYDAEGRRVACGKSGSAFAQNDTIAYAYNNRSELTNIVAVVDSNYRYAYDFDDIGNRETSSERGTNSVYTANSLNQYTEISDSALSASPRETFTPTYDDDGNQTLIKTATGIWSVTYNGENRPILWENVSTNSPTPNSTTPPLISMSYDRMGRRVTKNNQRFIYNGYLQIADNNGNAYVWDPTEKIATRPLVWNSSTFLPFNFSTSYYVHDGNKNVSDVVADNGDIAAHYEYAPFGSAIAQRGASAAANSWRFSSECTDNTLGIAYYNYRHYEPIVGKWTSRDPLGEKGCLHLYCYLCNETGKTDLLGLLWWPWSKRYCCSVCMYSAIDWDAYKKTGPLRLDEDWEGHTWLQYEDKNADNSTYTSVPSFETYSFGPEVGLDDNKAFVSGVPGGDFPIDDYVKPHKKKVVKKCWKMERKCCKKLRDKLNSKDKYPQKFGRADYCTTAALHVLKELKDAGCIESVPNGSGDVTVTIGDLTLTHQVPNPKDMAKDLESSGGESLWTEEDNKK